MRHGSRLPWLALPLLLFLAVFTNAQGEFVNFEEPQIAPIAIAPINGTSYVLACNTPDNSVEIYTFESETITLVTRVPVGLSPVTVRWYPEESRLYTCNFIGDSVSVVHLAEGDGLVATLERTENVGDEPTDILFDPANQKALVALHSRSSVVEVDHLTLALLNPTSPEVLLEVGTPGTERAAVKAPRRLAFLDDGRMVVLNTKGGNVLSKYDFDLFVEESNGTKHQVGGMGSTNTGLAYYSTTSPAEERMVVVGSLALNDEIVGIQDARDAKLGFVESKLWVLDPSTAAPGVEDEWDSSTNPGTRGRAST